MKNRLQAFNTIPFVLALFALLLNDFYLKYAFHNWFTGKLSDFCGLYVFTIFWIVLFPKQKIAICLITAASFCFWKSEYSQSLINFFSSNLFVINRVVDLTDLFSLIVLIPCFYHTDLQIRRLNFNPLILGVLAIFSFCATSVPRYHQEFDQPQYVLFKNDSLFKSRNLHDRHSVEMHKLDSIIIIEISSIPLEERPVLKDEYYKMSVLNDLDLRVLKEIFLYEIDKNDLKEFKQIRDRLTINGTTSVVLKRHGFKDSLNFLETRLHGFFKRSTLAGKLILTGQYKHGFEDSLWSYYGTHGGLEKRKLFRNGELLKIEFYKNKKLSYVDKTTSREAAIRNKAFFLFLIFALMMVLVIKLIKNHKRGERDEFIKLSVMDKVWYIIFVPFISIFLAKVVSYNLPDSHSFFMFGVVGEVILVYIICLAILIIIFNFIRLKDSLDIIYYILLFSLIIVFLEESFHLRSIIVEKELLLKLLSK